MLAHEYESKPHLAFVLYHTGETKGLLPSIRHFIKTGHAVSIIPMGQTAAAILAGYVDLHEFVMTPHGLTSKRYGGNDAFAQVLSDADIAELVALVNDADTVIIGFPAKGQLQLAEALALQDKQLIAYCDSFVYSPLIEPFASLCEVVCVTTAGIAARAQARVKGIGAKATFQPIGHGDVDTWVQIASRKLPALIQRRMGVDPSVPTVVWGGSYGRAEVASLTSFAEVMQHLPVNFRVAPHPGIARDDQKCEETYKAPLRACGMSEAQVSKTILDPNRVPTVEAVVGSDAYFSWGSTSTPQAAILGKQSGFYAPREFSLQFPPDTVRTGRTPLFNSKRLLAQSLKQLFQANSPGDDTQRGKKRRRQPEICPKDSAAALDQVVRQRR